jgi:phenylalanyl-tRNA synthetase beta chain
MDIVVMLMATMFAEYTDIPFAIEPVKIHYPDGRTVITPNVAPRQTTASHSYLNAATGLDLSREETCKLLNKMSLISRPSASDPDLLEVDVPCTRSDILHECDIMEDYAIAYGYNNLPTSLPMTSTVAKAFPINKLGDLVRKECAQAGWIEALPLILCSHDENFAWLNRPDPGHKAIALANPKSVEFQVVRTSLLPGLLKTVRENKALPLPLKVFEVSDVAEQDDSRERKARNFRRLGAVYVDRKAGFEVVHGLLDRVMQVLGVPFIGSKASEAEYGYYIDETTSATYLPGRAASVFLRPKKAPASGIAALKDALPGAASARDVSIGELGILHPIVLTNFELTRPASVLELDIEPML